MNRDGLTVLEEPVYQNTAFNSFQITEFKVSWDLMRTVIVLL